MDSYAGFRESIAIAVEKFKEIGKNEPIRLVSHLDADGISACSILIKVLNSNNRKYSVSIVQHLDPHVLSELSKEPYSCFIFSDLGSGQLSGIKKYLGDKTVFIFDHHKPEELKVNASIIHINPHLFGIDGSKEISGAGVAFLFARQLNKKIEESMAHIAIVGAIGDVQSEKEGFLKLNREILDIAVKNNKIKIIKGLRMFGAQTRPLHKVLEYCTDPYIPGVSGSESGAIQFLNHIGIDPKLNSEWKKIVNLSEDELKKLVAGIVIRRLGEDNPEDVLGDVYILNDEEKESALRDAKEFATLLNACGRLGKASLGIGVCLGDKKTKVRAIQNLNNYKKEIVNAMRWYEGSKDSEDVISDENYIIINAKDRVMPTMIGTIASILSKSNSLKKETFIMSMAQMLDGNTKVSLRFSGHKKRDIDLRDIIKEITEPTGGEAGGHRNAAGAIIPTTKEKEFIEKAREVLGKKAIEEIVR